MNNVERMIDSPRTISAPPNYHGWPTIFRRRNGELIAGFSGGRRQHVCPFGRVEMIRSGDDGLTWSGHEVLYDGPLDDRDTGVLETISGALLVTWFTSLAWEDLLAKHEAGEKVWLTPGDVEAWRRVRDGLDDVTRGRELGQWVIRSEDGGETWSDKINTIVSSPHGPVQLDDGRLLYAGKRLWTEDKAVGACESTDDGKTWRWIGTIPLMEGHDPKKYHELHAVEAADGRIIAQIRNHNEGAHQYETLLTESSDGGRSWSPARSIGVWGYPSHLLRLRDDRLLMTYGHRRDPQGQQARVSQDHGRTWSEAIILTGGGPVRDHGYPSTVQLDDDSLLTVWYECVEPGRHAEIREVRWRLG